MAYRDLSISSSALSAARYDEDTHTLVLDWNGGTYTYTGVPPSIAEGLEAAGSQGAYAHDYIRTSFPFRRGG